MSVIKKPDLKIFAQDAKTGEIETFPDVLRGWGVTLERTAGKPPLEWFNAIGKRVDEWLMYLTQRGLAEWDSTVDYPKDALVQHSSVFYVALKVTKGEQPNTSQNAWKPLVDFLGVNNKLDKTAVVQSTGTSTTSVMSQKASTDSFQPKGSYQPSGDYATNSALNNGLNNKFDKGNVVQSTGTSTVHVMSQKASTDAFQPKGTYPTTSEMNVEFNKKVDKASIAQQLANDVNKVPSLDLVTRELGKKQASGNYADKSSSATQSFSGSIIALKEVMSRNGNISLGIKTVDKPEVVFNFGTIWRILSFQDKDGTIALSGDSYTKAESNKQLDDIKNNVYSKSASDAKYGLKNTANNAESGWWKCGDTGLIYQWGKVSGSTSETDTRNFPIKFPNKCLIMFGSYIGNDWGGGVGCVIKSSSTFLQINHTSNASWSGAESNFLAIGY